MKICFISSRLFNGGFTTSMLNMIHALDDAGITSEVCFLQPDEHKLDVETLLQGHTYFNVQDFEKKEFVNRDKEVSRINNEIRKTRLLLKMTKNTEKKKLLETKLTQLRLLFHTYTKLPIVDLCAYDCVISWEELLCNDFLAMNVKAKKKIGYIHPDYVLSGYDRNTDLAVLKELDYVVGVSNATTKTMQDIFPEYKDKMLCIHNVLNTRQIEREKGDATPGFTKSSFDIVTVCRLSVFHKGLDRLVKTCAALEQQGREFEWYICGGGDGRAEVEQMMQELNVKHLHLLGMVKTPYSYLNQADMFALMSNYEGLPAVVFEAQYLNTPVVITNFASAHEQVTDGVNGWIVNRDDTSAAEKIGYLMDHPEQLEAVKKTLESEDKSTYSMPYDFLKLIGADHE